LLATATGLSRSTHACRNHRRLLAIARLTPADPSCTATQAVGLANPLSCRAPKAAPPRMHLPLLA